MGENESKSLDVLGIRPYGEAAKIGMQAAVDGAEALLSRICLPAAEELGLLFRDKVSHWRSQNTVKTVLKAGKKLEESGGIQNRHAHPRLVAAILEKSSWQNVDEIQEMWAGLLASSCDERGEDDSNLLFINLLSQLTSLQTKILNHVCKNSPKYASPSGLVEAGKFFMSTRRIMKVFGVDEIIRLDREFDHLRSLDLLTIKSGFPTPLRIGLSLDGVPIYPNVYGAYEGDELDRTEGYLEPPYAECTPSPLGLNLYVRCQGSTKSPAEFFNLINMADTPHTKTGCPDRT